MKSTRRSNPRLARDYFIGCGDCRQTTFNLTAAKANRDTCPKCGSKKIIIDRV
jgi:PHP family Zn ribbon phosphoesterase